MHFKVLNYSWDCGVCSNTLVGPATMFFSSIVYVIHVLPTSLFSIHLFSCMRHLDVSFVHVSLFILECLFVCVCLGYDFAVYLLLSRTSLKPHVHCANTRGKPVCKNGGTAVQRLRHKASQHKFLIQLLRVCAWTLHTNAQHLHKITSTVMLLKR